MKETTYTVKIPATLALMGSLTSPAIKDYQQYRKTRPDPARHYADRSTADSNETKKQDGNKKSLVLNKGY